MADMTDRKKFELDTFSQWKRTGDVKHFQDLYGSMKNLVHDAARRAAYGSNLPESAHRAYAAQAFFDALRTYDPKGGAALQTHVFNSVQNKVKRLNYMYSNMGHMPEPRMQRVGLYQAELGNLRSELNREPNAHELADRLSWGVSDVQKIQTELRKDLAMDEGTEDLALFESNKDEEHLSYLYFDLGAQEKVVYEYLYGKGGKPRMVKANGKIDYDGISRRMGISSSKARQLVVNIRQSLQKVLRK